MKIVIFGFKVKHWLDLFSSHISTFQKQKGTPKERVPSEYL